jgi:hypothetical protein
MLRSFRQHACSCCVHYHKPENASYRNAEARRTIETRHEGPEGALLFLRAKTRVGKRRKQVPQRGTILAFLYVESGNLYKATQSQLSIDSTLLFESRFFYPGSKSNVSFCTCSGLHEGNAHLSLNTTTNIGMPAHMSTNQTLDTSVCQYTRATCTHIHH